MKLRLTRVIGGKGKAPEQFTGMLRGICVDADDRLLAVGDRELKVYDADGGLVRRWPTAKFGHCVAVDGQGRIYVGEDGQVEQFDRAGALLSTFRDAGRLGKVTSICSLDDLLLLGDAANRCIRCYDGAGKWVRDIGAGNNTRGFMIPNGRLEFAVTADGVIVAAHAAKHRVERYRVTGELLGHFGRFGMRRPEDFAGCCNPTNVALTSRGLVVVTEKAPPRLKVYTADGSLVALVGPNAFDSKCKNMDVCVGASGAMFVADTTRLHICCFEFIDVESARPEGVSQYRSVGRGAVT